MSNEFLEQVCASAVKRYKSLKVDFSRLLWFTATYVDPLRRIKVPVFIILPFALIGNEDTWL